MLYDFLYNLIIYKKVFNFKALNWLYTQFLKNTPFNIFKKNIS